MTLYEIVNQMNGLFIVSANEALLESDEYTPFIYQCFGGVGPLQPVEMIFYGEDVLWDSENDSLCNDCNEDGDACNACPKDLWECVVGKAKELLVSRQQQVTAAIAALSMTTEIQ